MRRCDAPELSCVYLMLVSKLSKRFLTLHISGTLERDVKTVNVHIARFLFLWGMCMGMGKIVFCPNYE